MAKLTTIKPRVATLKGRISLPPKKAESFYQSKPWRALLAKLKAKRGRKCEHCGASGKDVRIIGDHIVERRDGGAELDPSNIQLLCTDCHAKKTAKAKSARRFG